MTPNDNQDPDEGGNDLQNFPVISSATVYGGTELDVSGTLNTNPNTSGIVIDFYANADGTCDSSGYGEGESWVGSTTVSTNSSGNGSFDVTLPWAGQPGLVITATATGQYGSTSEFSACVTAAEMERREAVPALGSAGLVFLSLLIGLGAVLVLGRTRP